MTRREFFLTPLLSHVGAAQSSISAGPWPLYEKIEQQWDNRIRVLLRFAPSAAGQVKGEEYAEIALMRSSSSDPFVVSRDYTIYLV